MRHLSGLALALFLCLPVFSAAPPAHWHPYREEAFGYPYVCEHCGRWQEARVQFPRPDRVKDVCKHCRHRGLRIMTTDEAFDQPGPVYPIRR
jgi:hypothetical protein